LAEPSTPDQIQQFSLVTDQEISPNESFWVGLTYNSTVEKYLWLSDNTEITIPYWEDNQPLPGVGDCVVFIILNCMLHLAMYTGALFVKIICFKLKLLIVLFFL
jgi:hypothetical protein